jgi:predicted DNA-binding ribbon-helix-helix protein
MFTIVKRSIVIAGRYTSVSIEEPFWSALKEIARARRTTLSELVHFIDDTYHGGGASNLSSAIRMFVLDYYRQEAQVESRAPKKQVRSTGRGTDKNE